MTTLKANQFLTKDDRNNVVETNIYNNYFIIPLIILFSEDVPEVVSEDVPEGIPLLASTGSEPTTSNTEVRSCSNDTDGPIVKQCF